MQEPNKIFELGSGPRRVAVLTAIAPRPPQRSYFETVLKELGSELTFEIYDPLSVHCRGLAYEGWVEHWSAFFQKNPREIFLGLSLGGCLVQELIDRGLKARGALLLSSPTRVSPALSRKLAGVLAQLDRKNAREAHRELEKSVGSASPIPLSEIDEAEALSRLKKGFEYFFHFRGPKDLSRVPTVLLYGADSRLVRRDPDGLAGNGLKKEVLGAGMRLLEDSPPVVRSELLALWGKI